MAHGTVRDSFGGGLYPYAMRITQHHHTLIYPANQSFRCQYFVATDDYQCTGVSILISKGSAWSHGDLVIEIRDVTRNFSPTGFVRAGGRKPEADVASGWNTVDFPTVGTINKNNEYGIFVYFDSALSPPSSGHIIYWSGVYDQIAPQIDQHDGDMWIISGPYQPWSQWPYIDCFYQVWGVDIGVPLPLPGWPTARPGSYNLNLFWQPGQWVGANYTGGSWSTVYQAAGGGRWGRNLVAAVNKEVWYEEFT